MAGTSASSNSKRWAIKASVRQLTMAHPNCVSDITFDKERILKINLSFKTSYGEKLKLVAIQYEAPHRVTPNGDMKRTYWKGLNNPIRMFSMAKSAKYDTIAEQWIDFINNNVIKLYTHNNETGENTDD